MGSDPEADALELKEFDERIAEWENKLALAESLRPKTKEAQKALKDEVKELKAEVRALKKVQPCSALGPGATLCPGLCFALF